MISTYIIDKGKSIVELASLSPFEDVYNAIQSTSDPTIKDHLLVASYLYHLPYFLDNPSPISILSFTYTSYWWIHYGSYVCGRDALEISSSSIFFPSPLPCGRRALLISGFIWCSQVPSLSDSHSWCQVRRKSMQYYENDSGGNISKTWCFR